MDVQSDMLELEFLRNLQEFPAMRLFWEFVTHLGDAGLVWIAIAFFLVCFSCSRKAGCAVGTALFAGFLVCNATLKPIVDRLRPCDLFPADLVYACPLDASFPSGHTTASFAAALALAAFYPRTGFGALLLAVLIAWSRLFLFVHWPTDVAAGMLIGALCAAYGIWLAKRAFSPLNLAERWR